MSKDRNSKIREDGPETVVYRTPRFVLFSGWVISDDGDEHHISARRLVDLYRLNPRECVLIESDKDLRGRDLTGLIELRPRFDGNYKLDGV